MLESPTVRIGAGVLAQLAIGAALCSTAFAAEAKPKAAKKDAPKSPSAADATGPTAPKAEASAAAPAQDSSDDQIVQMRGLEERVNDLKEKIFRSKARLMLSRRLRSSFGASARSGRRRTRRSRAACSARPSGGRIPPRRTIGSALG